MIDIFDFGKNKSECENGLWRNWTPPNGFVLYSSGDAALTKTINTLCSQRGITIYREKVKRKGFWTVKGYYVPVEVENEAKSILASKRGSEKEWREKRKALNEAKEKRDQERFVLTIKQVFPAIPETDAALVARRACQVGSGRVGRTGTISTVAAVVLAVRAHVRHNYTDYDDLLEERTKYACDRDDRADIKAEVRHEVADQIEAIVDQWRKE